MRKSFLKRRKSLLKMVTAPLMKQGRKSRKIKRIPEFFFFFNEEKYNCDVCLENFQYILTNDWLVDPFPSRISEMILWTPRGILGSLAIGSAYRLSWRISQVPKNNLKERYTKTIGPKVWYVSSILGCQKGTLFFIRVAPVGNWYDNTQLPGYNEIHPS